MPKSTLSDAELTSQHALDESIPRKRKSKPKPKPKPKPSPHR
jgi:hypothetical protein